MRRSSEKAARLQTNRTKGHKKRLPTMELVLLLPHFIDSRKTNKHHRFLKTLIRSKLLEHLVSNRTILVQRFHSAVTARVSVVGHATPLHTGTGQTGRPSAALPSRENSGGGGGGRPQIQILSQKSGGR